MKRTSNDDDLRLVYAKELGSRIDEGLTSLDCDEGTDGEKFMQEMLDGLHLHRAKNARSTLRKKATGKHSGGFAPTEWR